MKCSASSLLNKNNYDSDKLVTAYFPVTLDLPGKGGGGEEGEVHYIYQCRKKVVQRKPFFDILKSLRRLQ